FKDGMSAILFNKTELDALNTEENFNKLADPDLVETIPITAIADKKITLEREPLDGTFTDIIISENEGFFQIGQLTNFEANESQDEISVDTQTSGGYKSSIGGLKSASIEGIAGIYDASIPTVAILMAAYNNESTVRVRQGAMKVKFAPYTVGIYKVSEFTTSGEVSGNSKLEYKSALKLQSGQIEKKIFN
ncbi:MAG: phage tail tube protein, partial [Cetobacterium sp.]